MVVRLGRPRLLESSFHRCNIHRIWSYQTKRGKCMVPDVWPPLIQGVLEILDEEESRGVNTTWRYFNTYALTIRCGHCPRWLHMDSPLNEMLCSGFGSGCMSLRRMGFQGVNDISQEVAQRGCLCNGGCGAKCPCILGGTRCGPQCHATPQMCANTTLRSALDVVCCRPKVSANVFS